MKAFELVAQMREAVSEHGTAGSLVMVKSNLDGRMFTPHSVEVESHEDGSFTVWLRVEEF
jgi:hypothetical protein